jgi:molybdate transport system substrate-binding protein
MLIAIALCSSCGSAPGNVTVLAAASLTGPFTSLAAAFEAGHPGIEVALSFASSATLATQVREGAAADVFATANQQVMQEIVAEGLASAPQVFATNRMALIVEAGNPRAIGGLGDLDEGLIVALCVDAAPCGSFAGQLFARAGLPVPEAAREPNVKAVLTKVALGEADAGIVYQTDPTSAVTVVPLPEAHNITASYPIAVLTDAPQAEDAAAFVAFVTSPAGQGIMAEYGFLP